MHSPALRASSIALLTLCACGGAAPPAPAEAPLARASAPSSPGTFSVSGLRGTLSNEEIKGALEPRMPRFLRCIERRLSTLELLGGEITLSFEVSTDGTVVDVFPTDSTLGDREAERCILEVAKATRFPPPHGGPTDFRFPLEVPADPEVRPPVELPSERASLGDRGERLHAECGGGQVVVTAYVAPDGSVLAAGVAAPDGATEVQLDCVAEGVRALRFDSPGSYAGKLSFTLP